MAPGHNTDEYFRQLSDLTTNGEPLTAALDALANEFDLRIVAPPLHD